MSASGKKSPERRRVVVLADLAYWYSRENLRGIIRYARSRGRWTIVPYLFGGRQKLSLAGMPCDGALGDWLLSQVHEELAGRRIPGVCVASGDLDWPFAFVIPDNAAIGRLAGEHFLERGFRNFAYVGYMDRLFSTQRRDGFAEVVCDSGEFREFIPAGYADTGGIEGKDKAGFPDWIRDLPRPVGVLAADEYRAWELLMHCLEIGVRVPEELSILAAGNDELICESAAVPLSGIEFGADRIGYRAAELLDGMMDGESPPKEPIPVPPLEVVVRWSSDMLAIPVPEVADAVRFIRQRACDPIGVPDVLREVPVGRRWLERQFRSILGRTVNDCIAAERVRRAKELLTHTDLNVSQVAEKCGFEYEQHFCAFFRRTTGATPADYRRRYALAGRTGFAEPDEEKP